MERKANHYNELIARNGDEYYMLEDIVNYPDGMHGATGAIFVPISKAQIEQDTTQDALEERFEDSWKYAVAHDGETCSLSDFAKSVYNSDGYEAIYDFSFYSEGKKIAQKYNEENGYTESDEEYAEFCECLGCGRIFGKKKEFKLEHVYNQELLNKIIEVEGDDNEN